MTAPARSPQGASVPAWCDRWHRRARRLWHPVDFHRRWFKEVAGFYRHLSREEFWLRYHEERKQAKAIWARGDLAWDQCDFFVLRQAYYHRDACWHQVAARIPKHGTLLEYGCGIAPVSAWMARHRPDVRLAIADVPSRTLDFATRRLPQAEVVDLCPPPGAYDTVVCYEVMEHVPDPRKTLGWLIQALKPGGYLLLDYVDAVGDGGADGRHEALQLLYGALHEVQPIQPRGVFRKP